TGRPYNIDQAAQLARQLARFIDDVAREGASFDNLAALVPEELATHWQQTLDFLHIISHQWPQILQGENAIDPVTHRNAVLAAVIENWQKNPPQYPIIAAGSTGSQPATARLLAAINQLPKGVVILPGLDWEMPENEWEKLRETHPQFALRNLLETMKKKRADVSEFGGSAESQNPREALLRTIFQPEEATTHWRATRPPLESACAGVGLLSADTPLEEARMIAIAMREVLETPEKTAALVTPDRTLARMAAGQMQRFGVKVDDSAGTPLLATAPAAFLRLTVEMVASGFAPNDLLALLRHPLAAVGFATADCRRISRQLEIFLLRGIRFESGVESLLRAAKNSEDKYPEVEALLTKLAQQSGVFAAMFNNKKPLPLGELLGAHMQLCEDLASTDEQAGNERLWSGEAGAALASKLADIMAQADILQEVDPISYPRLLCTLLADASYYSRFGLHPRLHILSPMEARLQHYDLVILAGLNEGTWPALASADPWMSRPMREKFGLPASERAIGQSAHDVYQLCCAKELLLTRAAKNEGAPTVPSRWLVRLQTLVGGHAPELLTSMQQNKKYAAMMAEFDAPLENIPALTRPLPCPPLSARPKKLSVSAVDRWLADPYTVYAQYVLRLRALEPLDKEPDAADFGEMVHAALENFVRQFSAQLPDNALAKLLECGREAFAKMIDRPAVACLWWPRFEGVAAWLIERENERRKYISNIAAEREGIWQLDVDGSAFTLTTRIDRLECLKDGSTVLIDYKTGTPPTAGDIKNGKANQLPLGALVAQKGELHPALGRNVRMETLEYWKLAGSSEDSEVVSVSAEQLMEAAEARLVALIREFGHTESAFGAQSDPTKTLTYNDFEHLTRRAEWEAQ
ncbi:MAG: double-strand break repair protein AddB, partial [Alphaproteobacteria bacterium]|nr:double-strand break repair protein AddB [Alphaproteobacteria bacterium]